MISQVRGTIMHRELDRVEIMTASGVAYECLIPLSVFESLPSEGQTVTLHTHLVVREDAWHLYGFAHAYERAVFQKLLHAKGVGPALALGILSALTPDRVVRALHEKDVLTLMRVHAWGARRPNRSFSILPTRSMRSARPRQRERRHHRLVTTPFGHSLRWVTIRPKPTGPCVPWWKVARQRMSAVWCVVRSRG